MLLFGLWAAHRGRLLTGTDMAALDAAVAPWRADIVRPLRAIRRALKAGRAEVLRDMVKSAELEAERQQQARMEPLLPLMSSQPKPDLAEANLAAYAGFAGLSIPTEAATLLAEATRSVPASPE